MKKLLLSASLLLCFGAFSQTTLFQDDFESGSTQWTLNTGSGANNWTVNNAYLGFSGLIPDTPNQPGAITNGPQSTYMHITNTTICAGLSVCNANFDTGSASNQNTEIASSIDASLYTNVTVSFWYLCAGQTGTSYGTMEYSLDGGSTWIGTGTEYSGVSSWTQESVSLPAWNNAAQFKIRFKWQNGGGGLDPAFAIDEVLIVGTAGAASNTIITGTNIQPTEWCEGSVITTQVNFTSTGTFNAGNVYTAEMSDATGSFAAPTVIGTLNSVANSGMIVGVIPGSMPAGNGYRIRVVSDNPATVGTDNTVDLVINPLPTVTMTTLTDVCLNDPAFTLTAGSPGGGTYSGVGVSTNMFDPSAAGLGTHSITYSYTDGNGCGNTTQETITVNPCGATNTITTSTNIQPTEWCEGSPLTIQVDFTSTGTFNAANIYSAEISDAAGSFAAPIVIGTLNSAANSGTIISIVPGSMPAGTGYRIRVVSDNPATTGTDNTIDLVINSLPTVTMATFADVCVYDAFFTLTGGSPAGGTYTGPGVTANVFDPTVAGVGTHSITYSFTDGSGCSGTTQETITVDACSGLEENQLINFVISPNPTDESFVITTSEMIEKVQLLDMSGRIIKEYDEQPSYNVSDVPQGVYIVKLFGTTAQAVERIMIK